MTQSAAQPKLDETYDEPAPTPMMLKDYEAFGKLVKTWSTGSAEYLGRVYPLPRSLDEFIDQCREAKVGLTLPKEVKAFALSVYDYETLYIRVPPKERVLATEKRLKEGQPYFVKPFYGPMAFGDHKPHVPQPEALKFHACRIGDYTISYCE